MKLGDYLREQREAKGWTQPEAAQKAGIEQSYLSKLETGKSYPSEDVFGRLCEAYGMTAAEAVKRVASSELSKLKDVADVRAAILDRQRSERGVARGWLLGMLGCLLAGGAFIGLTLLAVDRIREEFDYKSWGVVKLDEPLGVFDVFNHPYDLSEPGYEAQQAAQRALLPRLDIETEMAIEPRGLDGQWYIKDVPDGRRVFRMGVMRKKVEPSPLRWFLVPGIALLVGAVGCGFISFRWK